MELEFKYRINEILEVDEMLIVLLESPLSYTRNVYGVNSSREISWQIDNFISDVGFTHIYILDGKLWAGNWSGMHYCLDPKSGEIIDRIFLK